MNNLEMKALAWAGIILPLLLVPLLFGCPGGSFPDGEGKPGTVRVTEDSAHEEHAEAGEEAGHSAHGEEEEAGHAAHGGGDSHEGHDHAELIELDAETLAQYGVETGKIGPGSIELYLTLPGEVAVNEDRLGHVLPRLAGVVKSVGANKGDLVKKGALLAVVESRELASAKSDYIAASERLAIAVNNMEREKLLFEKGVSPELDYINAQNAVREAEIEQLSAAQTLKALGISEDRLSQLSSQDTGSLTRYEIYAPISGRILEKHVSVGEMVDTTSELFLIADLSQVWVNLNIGQKDLPQVREGQTVRIRFSPTAALETDWVKAQPTGIPDAEGTIDYIDALVAADTRSAQARIELDNSEGHWRPGMFVTGLISVDSVESPIVVPLEAIISFEGVDSVIVHKDGGFAPRTVVLGRSSASEVEVSFGLMPGETIVTKGAFMVKAELGKSEAGHGH